MKKGYFLFVIILFHTSGSHCQTINSEVIAPGGGFMSTPEFSNSYTIGEMCLIETFQFGISTLTQGFQQPEITKPSNANVFIPNGITPNGDGVNDTWAIPDLLNYPDCTIKIYNRWGQQLFGNSGYTQQWNGTYQGNLLPSADYYYVITLDGDSKTGYTGTITIKR